MGSNQQDHEKNLRALLAALAAPAVAAALESLDKARRDAALVSLGIPAGFLDPPTASN